MRRAAIRSDGPVGVLLLTKGLGRGGTERLLASSVRHVDPARFRVEVAYLLPHKDAFVPDIEECGVPVHCLDAPRPTDLGWVLRLRRLVREHNIGLLHTHAPVPAVVARLAVGRRTTIVHTEHNVWDRYRWPTRIANSLTFRRNAAVIAVSDGVAESIHSRVPVDVVVHGIDNDAMCHGPTARQHARERLELPVDAPVIATVGNFTPKKDHASLLAAFAKVRAELPNARLVLIGLGPLEDQLREQTKDLGIDEAVQFTGSRDDVFELLPGFDIFTLSSRYEGLPIALLEAMGSGVAPVATRVGGIPEVISNGVNGVLIEAGDVDALATALVNTLRDGQLRNDLAEAARTRAADFDLAHAVQRIEAIYQKALAP